MLVENISRAWNRTSDLLFPSRIRVQLSYRELARAKEGNVKVRKKGRNIRVREKGRKRERGVMKERKVGK